MTDKGGGKKGKKRKKGKKVSLPPLKVEPPQEEEELLSPATVELVSPEKVSPVSPELLLPETDEAIKRREEEEQSALWDQIDDEHMDLLPEGTSPSCESEPILEDPTRRRSRSLSHSTFRTDSSSDENQLVFRRASAREASGLILWPNNRMASPLTSPLGQSASASNLFFSSTAKIVRPADPFSEGNMVQKRRANSTSELLKDQLIRRRTLFESDYSTEARSLLKRRNNSHFLPSYHPEPLPKKTRKRIRAIHLFTAVLKTLLSALVVYTSFVNIAIITHFNPLLKVLHYSGRMLFPILDAAVNFEAADNSLWLAGQLGYFRALGRFSGTYRKLFVSTSSPPPSAGTLELVLYYLHWLLDFLYFPTEHLGLVEWEAYVFGIKSRLFFVQANAVVWYWRQIVMLALCIHACYTERLALSAGASLFYFAAVIADLMTAYAFLPFAPSSKSPKAPKTLKGKIFIWLTTRNFTVGLGMCGFFGVCEGLIQMALRHYYM
eukprot:TRINITY_DN18948_c0_g1_i1.p1 TRINITY_DN18948_c0_g1~~TRINITY_DN18948_c0_g1_i1.p1  ORF type:complete len:494 (+),score=51.63 TRINITY_DN18948_c0_g1_i1:85-1566(+)